MNISGDEVATCSLQDNFAAVMRASNASLLADRMEKVLLFLKTHNSEIENLPIYLVEEIRSIISTENLLKLWLQLLHLQVSSFATAKYYSNLMFNGHRSWAHLDCDRLLCPDLCRQSYLTSIAASFCQTLTADTSEEAHMQWGKIASLLSTEAKRYIYKQVHQNRQLIEISTRYLDSEMSLDFLTAFLSSGRTRSPSGACASPPDDGILRALVSACLTHWGIDVVFNRIVMHASSDETASAIVKCFSDHRAELLLFARLTAQLWGTAHVIRRGNKSMHCFLSTILLLIIPTLTQAELMEAPPEAALRGVHKKRDSSARQSTLSYLSLGVSACLDVADAGLRSRAMTVAKAFSKIMGVELDYSEDVPVENKKPPEKDKSRPAMEKSTTAYITDNNASDESDLESYLIDTEDDEPNDTANLIEGATGVSKEPSKFKTNYLRVCLECKLAGVL